MRSSYVCLPLSSLIDEKKLCGPKKGIHVNVYVIDLSKY